MQIAGRVFVVTGGGNGIGREVVLGLLREGARVAALDLRADGLTETFDLASAAGVVAGRLTTHTVDIADPGAVEAAATTVLADHGTVDGLFNIAGIIQPFVPFGELGLDDMAKVMAVNFWGVVHTTKAFLPTLTARPEACLVNVSSMGAFAPVPGQTIYGASKAAVTLLTEGLYAELRESGVAVTVVFPGGVATSIATNSGAAIPGGGDKTAKMTMTLPTAAAAQIIAGAQKGSFRVVIGKDARAMDVLARVSPRRATEMIAKKMKALLGP